MNEPWQEALEHQFAEAAKGFRTDDREIVDGPHVSESGDHHEHPEANEDHTHGDT